MFALLGGARALRVVLALSLLLPALVPAQWKPVGALKLPQHNYSFLAATPSGDLLAVTFNSAPADTPPRAMPALLVRNPTTPAPEVIELCRTPFMAQRGYGGVACHESGQFFVSGDTGEPGTCFVRKFNPDGTPDPTFAANGELRPNRRTLGMDVLGNTLFVAADWGRILLFDTQTGRALGETPAVPGPVYVRDVAIDPKSMRLFGVAEGSAVTWGGGAPWKPMGYVFRPLTPKSGELRAGEGISIDPIHRTVLLTPIPGNVLHEIAGNGRIARHVIASAKPNAHLADSVLSFDGETLFVSDITGRLIHVMRRSLANEVADNVVASATSTPLPAISGTVAPVTWHKSYTEIVQEAREQNRPMVVYFRRSGFDVCDAFEKNILLTDAFNEKAAGFTCVFEDVSTDNRLLAYRFGVYRVPHMVVLDGQGNVTGEFTFNIPPDDLFAAMKRATGN